MYREVRVRVSVRCYHLYSTIQYRKGGHLEVHCPVATEGALPQEIQSLHMHHHDTLLVPVQVPTGTAMGAQGHIRVTLLCIRETAAVLSGTSCSLGLGKKLPAKQKRNLSHFVLLFWTAGVFSDKKEHKAQTTLDQK